MILFDGTHHQPSLRSQDEVKNDSDNAQHQKAQVPSDKLPSRSFSFQKIHVLPNDLFGFCSFIKRNVLPTFPEMMDQYIGIQLFKILQDLLFLAASVEKSKWLTRNSVYPYWLGSPTLSMLT